MPFQLRIEFSGLCLYVVHEGVVHEGVVRKGERQVTVLMPDARRQPNLGTLQHIDDTEAVPHAGYLRFDLGNALPGIAAAPNNSAGPRNEGVHRFDYERLDLGLPATTQGVNVDELEFPDFRAIDGNLSVPAEFFGNLPPKQLLMRTVLTGGRFTTHSGGSNWSFPDIAGSGGGPYQGQFANFATWTSDDIPGNELTLTIARFTRDNTPINPINLKLRPEGSVIRLTIANLCAENPLEWPELKIRIIEGERDLDFKWLYRLFDARVPVPIGPDGQLPVPILDRSSGAAGEEQDCTGGKIGYP